MKIDLDIILKDAKGEPFFVMPLDGNAVYGALVAWQGDGTTLADAIKRIEQLAGGKDNVKPMDLGDLFYRANGMSDKMAKGSRTEKRVRGELEELLVKRGPVDFTPVQIDAIKEDCEDRYSGAVLVRIDRIFAQAVIDAAPKPEGKPELVKEDKAG
jgi:hypothetical protein